MKINNKIQDVEDFMKFIDSCNGKMELVTVEGDRLNLKSKLSQYVSLDKLLSDSMLGELEIIAYEPEDNTRLVNYLMGN